MCRVTLDMETSVGRVVIVRKKGSARLLVTHGGETVEGIPAQGFINSTFPRIMYGYIPQKFYKSFVYMTPADRLKYIEDLAFDKAFVVGLVTKCKELVSLRKGALEKASTEKSSIEDTLISLDVEKITDCERLHLLESKLDKLKQAATRTQQIQVKEGQLQKILAEVGFNAGWETIKEVISLLEERQQVRKRTSDEIHAITLAYPSLPPVTYLNALIHKVQEYNSLEDDVPVGSPTQDVDDLQRLYNLSVMVREKRRELDNLEPDCLAERLEAIDVKLQEVALQKQLLTQTDSYTLWKRVLEAQAREKKYAKSFPRAVKLLDMINQAEKLALDDIIGQINFYASYYLSHFMDGITTHLSFEKKLEISIRHNGKDSSIDCLSGGETARVVLAYTLAIAKILELPFILLDECTASLDQDITGRVIFTIKEHYPGKIICIAQTTTGIFNKVIEM